MRSVMSGALAVSLWAVSPASFAGTDTVPALKHVMIVIFENEDAGPSGQQPFFAKLAQGGAAFSDFHAEAHPSQPNYIALTSGGKQGVANDTPVNLGARNIADLIEAKGKTWKVYAEDYPGNCFTGTTSGRYARKHNPFISYTDISGDAQRCANIVNATQMATDIANGQLPDYAFYVPNLDNDAHDTNLAYADNWYSGAFGPLLTDRNFMDGMLLITTFDESTASGGNIIYASLYGDMVKPGSTYSARADHYSLLRTIEDGLSLGNLAGADSNAASIGGIWQ